MLVFPFSTGSRSFPYSWPSVQFTCLLFLGHHVDLLASSHRLICGGNHTALKPDIQQLCFTLVLNCQIIAPAPAPVLWQDVLSSNFSGRVFAKLVGAPGFDFSQASLNSHQAASTLSSFPSCLVSILSCLLITSPFVVCASIWKIRWALCPGFPEGSSSAYRWTSLLAVRSTYDS